MENYFRGYALGVLVLKMTLVHSSLYNQCPVDQNIQPTWYMPVIPAFRKLRDSVLGQPEVHETMDLFF